ncbi:hypothetical protein GCM10022225_82000 [Plantactinospora mayteni]|uniref:Uncharacterized protein n=1 Tax=Plantactinospora mayteni TaxID=566021 RepID=A0ABQ4F3Y6_9ACTN|nr:hypothetical protein Pma05_81930 [Plantactinospora mayteni]
MTDTPTANTPPVGLWRRLGRWLLAFWRWLFPPLAPPEPAFVPITPPPSPPGRLTERRRLAQPIVVPARGYVFSFNVHATFIWSSDGLPREMLGGLAQYFMPYAIRAITQFVAARARNHPAHRARELEAEIQRALADGDPWRYERGGMEVTCRPHVWVELDEHVKQTIRPYWEELIKIDCEHDVDVKRAQYAERLSRQWLAVLEKLVGSPIADGAAQMTSEKLAKVVEKLVAEQKAETRRVHDLLNETIRNGEPFEQAEAFDVLIETHRNKVR